MLEKLMIGYIVFMLILAVISIFLPSEIRFEREISIKAKPEAIFPYLTNFRKFNIWSPWAKQDPNVKWTYEGEGLGSKMSWNSNISNVGKGTREILEVCPYVYVKNNLTFGKRSSFTTYTLTPDREGGQTKIVWEFYVNIGLNPYSKYLGLVLEKLVGPDYEKGLKNLKALLEKQ